MQVSGTTGGPNIGLVNCFKDVYTQEGISGLWRVYIYIFFFWQYMEGKDVKCNRFYLQGVNPTAQRAAVIAAIELPVYDFCKSHLMSLLGDKPINHFM